LSILQYELVWKIGHHKNPTACHHVKYTMAILKGVFPEKKTPFSDTPNMDKVGFNEFTKAIS
jgi:hypothetical protein